MEWFRGLCVIGGVYVFFTVTGWYIDYRTMQWKKKIGQNPHKRRSK